MSCIIPWLCHSLNRLDTKEVLPCRCVTHVCVAPSTDVLLTPTGVHPPCECAFLLWVCDPLSTSMPSSMDQCRLVNVYEWQNCRQRCSAFVTSSSSVVRPFIQSRKLWGRSWKGRENHDAHLDLKVGSRMVNAIIRVMPAGAPDRWF